MRSMNERAIRRAQKHHDNVPDAVKKIAEHGTKAKEAFRKSTCAHWYEDKPIIRGDVEAAYVTGYMEAAKHFDK